MKMKNIFFQNLELKHFAHIALPVGFRSKFPPDPEGYFWISEVHLL